MDHADEILEKQRSQWSQAAAGWEKWHAWQARSLRDLLQWFLTAARLEPGMNVLDVGSGTGHQALGAAERVAPGGRVEATDLSEAMLAVAARRARERGLSNLTFRVMDAENLRFPDSTFDAVTSGFALMFCPDPVRAAAQMRRVLRPECRLALTVWDVMEKNPFFSIVGRAVGSILEAPLPDPDAPGVFRLSAPGALERVLREAGFAQVEVTSFPMTWELDSLEHYVEMLTDCAAPLRAAIAGMSDEQRVRLWAMVAESAREHQVGTRLPLRVTALCAVAQG